MRHLESFLSQGGRHLNKKISKISNARGLPGGGGGGGWNVEASL